MFHSGVGGGWCDVHGVPAGYDRRVGVVPGVVPGDADENDDSGDEDEAGEECGFGAIVSAGEPERTVGIG